VTAGYLTSPPVTGGSTGGGKVAGVEDAQVGLSARSNGVVEPTDGRPAAPADIDLSRVPRHVGCVMDGNGRWAAARGLPRTEGHAAGEEALWDTVDGALAVGVRWLTVYAFSTENWRRPVSEVRYLMGFNEGLLLRRRDDLHRKGVRIRFAGRRDWRVPRRLVRRMDEAIELTRSNRRLTLTFAFNYGGRAEIVDAVRALVADGVRPDQVTERALASHLYYPDMPDCDLVVRTSGEYRISNFLLWQLAYSELVFTDVLWPDFRREHLYAAIREYQRRDRRFGRVTPTVTASGSARGTAADSRPAPPADPRPERPSDPGRGAQGGSKDPRIPAAERSALGVAEAVSGETSAGARGSDGVVAMAGRGGSDPSGLGGPGGAVIEGLSSHDPSSHDPSPHGPTSWGPTSWGPFPRGRW